MSWTLKESLEQLEALADEKMHAQNKRHGSGDNQFGVRLGKIRKLAKQIKSNHELALELWKTENVDARRLAILLIKPKQLSSNDLDKMVRDEPFTEVADWFTNYIVKKHPEKETLRQQWMNEADPMAGRAGWALTAERVVKSPDGLDLPALLDRIEAEMGDAATERQWTMNFVLAEIGIHFPEHRERALAIGESLGVYSDFKAPKGCISPYAPIWIREMVSRQ